MGLRTPPQNPEQKPIPSPTPAPAEKPDEATPLTGLPDTLDSGEKIGETPVPPQPQPIFKYGKKVFNSQEDLVDYIQKLEQNASSAEVYKQALESMQSRQVVPDSNLEKPVTEDEGFVVNGVRVDEILWEDPALALKTVYTGAKAEALRDMEVMRLQDEKRKSTWDTFYRDNPDLDIDRDLVTDTLGKHPELLQKPTAEGLSLLADFTRNRIAKIRENGKPSEVLPGAQVTGAGVTGAPATPVPADPQQKVVDFVTQLKQSQIKRVKK